ncbi:MAG: TonB-dependent receptor [Flavobacteriales bacterium]|nr:TonB-dependent receptor [Flavobacteriales bacterium]
MHFACFAQTTSIRGSVMNKTNNEPVAFASVFLQNTQQGTETDIEGNFVLQNILPGLYNIQVDVVGFKNAVVYEVEASIDRPAFLSIQLEEVNVELSEVEVAASSISNREESPVSVRTIGTNEIKRNPGGNRDISKVIRSLPGVAAIPSFRNDIIIRGGAANENRFYIDGIEIPNINHFATQGSSGGPVGLINVDLIDEVEFYSGAFPASRGNALSSVLEFGFREARDDKYTANFVVGSSDLGVTLEGPTGKNSGLIFSARRSYLQFLFAALGLPFLPTYNDVNTKWKWNVDEKNQLTIIGLGAYDDFALNLELDDDSTDENFSVNNYLLDQLVVNRQWNYTIGARWDSYREKGRWTFVASRNALQNDTFKHLQNDDALPLTFDYSSRETENKFRIENKISFGEGWKTIYGVSYEFADYFNRSSFEEFNYVLDTVVKVNYKTEFNLQKYGAFAQASKTFFSERLVLSAGVRADGNDYSASMKNPAEQISPRISARYSFAPQWSLNASTGIYYQMPSYIALGFQQDGIFLNGDMKYILSKQAIAGIEYDWQKRNSVITLEGFYKHYENYPVSVVRGISLANLGADFGTVGNEDIASIGLGRAYGVEFLYQQKLYEGFYGILAYTFVRSEFTGADGKFIASSWDSRNLVSVTTGKKFEKNWEVGIRFQYSGGLPFTPDNVEASMFITTWDAVRIAQPEWSLLNSQRINAFHQLDVRVDKKWYFERWTLDLFLDVQNLYNNITPLKPILDVQRDGDGNPVVNPDNPNLYLPNFLDASSGTVLPSIGIIVEL